jgi:hypothetical protein
METAFATHTDSPLEIIAAAHVNDIQDAVNVIEGILTTGWVPAEDTWVYASAATFTIADQNRTDILTKGTKLKLMQTTAKYFYVVSSAYADGDTTVTVTGGSDYTLADAAITGPYYSRVAYPVGFPEWFNYTPTGVSAAGCAMTGRFRVIGLSCECYIALDFTGAITFTTHPTLPITAAAGLATYDDGDADLARAGIGAYFDSGTATLIDGLFPSVASSATVVTLTKADGASMSATAPITWANNDQATVRFSYEI